MFKKRVNFKRKSWRGRRLGKWYHGSQERTLPGGWGSQWGSVPKREPVS